MIIDFYEGDRLIGTMIDSPTGLRATGSARDVLTAARTARLSDVQIKAKYQDWSNGYQRSQERRPKL